MPAGMDLALAARPGRPGSMTPLHVLLIEDSEDDAALVTRTLRLAGYDVRPRRVCTADELRTAMDERQWDLAIADYTMPSFSGIKALAIIQESGVDLPFIFVSATIGEHIAVEAMKQGAHDYIMKGNLTRLAPAVERELREATVRRERARANERVAYLAYHDPVTDLPNRALLQERLTQSLLIAKRDKKSLSLMMLDLDGFKDFNDALGHHAGDRVLQRVASRLRATLREADTVARLGSDEFAMMLPLTDVQGAELTARKILEALEQPLVVDGRPLVVRGCIGIATYPNHGSSVEELRKKADVAMHLAKSDRTGYAVYTADRDRDTARRLSLLTALRRGLDEQQFVVEYQPIVDLRTSAVIAMEALIRWNHPEQGRLLPNAFLQIADHTGLITPLTMFVIERAFADWPLCWSTGPVRLAVNLSPRTLQDPAFPARVGNMLAARRLNPATLTFEITENVIMSDPELSARSLKQLHDLGIRISVDDFGTGYSSLSYLRQLPVDELKIDQSFVIGLSKGEDAALVRSIVGLAHNLGLTVVAEGVETEDVCERLKGFGCEAAQGYHICRPESAVQVGDWMRSRGAVDFRAKA
jgi:diguanylate cyclase